MNNKNVAIYVIGFALIAALAVGALWYGGQNGAEFGGADDGAEDVVGDQDPDYKPWTDGIWGDYELPGEVESMLFALQAAIGAVIIGYFIGRFTAKKQ